MQLLLRQRKSLWGFVASAFCAVFFSADTAIAQTYNQIRFVIGTGGADLRGDCQATATLKATNGSTLKTITLYSGSGSGWPNNSNEYCHCEPKSGTLALADRIHRDYAN
jgi:hypothetical protein